MLSQLWQNFTCEIPEASTYRVDEEYEQSISTACSNERIVTVPTRCRSTGAEVSVAYHTFGSPSNPCVLLVMGLNSQAIAWDHEFCELLAAAGPYYVIRYDNRDCGKSSKFESVTWTPKMLHYALPQLLWKDRFYCYAPYTLSDMAADGMGLLDALHISKAHVVGISMGGMIAQVMAIEYPDRVLSLTSIMSAVGRHGQAGASLPTKLTLIRQPKSLHHDDVAAYRVWWAQKVCGNRNVDVNRVFTLARFGAVRSTYRGGLPRQTAAIMHAPCRDAALRRLKVPALVIHGDADVLVPFENGIDTFAALTNQTSDSVPRTTTTVYVDSSEAGVKRRRYVRLSVKEGMGHVLFQEDFDWVVREIVSVAKEAGTGTPN
mmetsp:Transcript_8407/g.9498  ORF Transcript_8407/g.9498 Transcript_8407/m.9498 type:complete len:375 (+) Transcript_8407:43-1167(+)|eukprot:CAMPEP_0176419398 /NCGR_PEP_ID=MMETSP0127-20121128/8025_1 /TAXON_ID=938130 /ORGANISM="Platyophrya macrostoma, Strain WH" /LENGTH=374 /DNA_ID=CAMNT_0017799871 /DNA_START=48 /DNA_END=1172 /DNA_ORIENTATION=-